jgi:hypothetical protein
MRSVLLLLVILAAPLCAERSYESAFGENTLAKCDLIVHAIAAAKRVKIGAAVSVQLTVQEVLHGEEKSSEITLIYSDSTLLKEGESVEGLFALKTLADAGYSCIGRPIPMPSGDAEARTKVAVCKRFLALEEMEEGEARTDAFENLLASQIAQGGYPGQNAAVELLLWVSRKPGQVSKARYDRFKGVLAESKSILDKRAQKDVELALQGMVELQLKDASFRSIRRGKTKQERMEGGKELAGYFEDYPRAFGTDDASLADALAKECKDGDTARDNLSTLAESIRREIKARKIEEEGKRTEGDERVRHAEDK